MASTSIWRGTDESASRALQAGPAGRGVRRDQDRARFAREDPLVVLRRGEEAGDHQLPHLQAGARRPVLRQDLRADQGLRVPLRQVQAPQAPRRDLREMRRRSDAGQGAPGADGPHRARQPGGAHLVPEVAAFASGPGARHDAARHRARAVLRSLCGHRPGPHAAQAHPAAHRGRLSRQGRGVRRRLLRGDGRRGHPRAAALARPQQGDRRAAQGARGHHARTRRSRSTPSA